MKQRGLTNDQIKQYRCDGYLVLPCFFGPDVVESVCARVRQITDNALASGDYRSVLEVEPDTAGG